MKKYLMLLLILLIYIQHNFSFDNLKEKKIGTVTKINTNNLAPPSLQVYYAIKHYAKLYNIPEKIAFGIARNETSFRNPMNFKYNHKQISSAKAMGTMQVQYRTAKDVEQNKKFTKEELLNNIDLNVNISLKYLRQLYNRYKNWDIALGYYNTGYPKINEYALSITRK